MPGGPTSQQLRVRVIGERLVEPDETFFLNILHATGAVVGDGQSLATIINDDSQPAIAVGDAMVCEGHRGTVDLGFAVRLAQPTFLPVQVCW